MSNRGEAARRLWRKLVVKVVMGLGAVLLAAEPVDRAGRQNAALVLDPVNDELESEAAYTPEEVRNRVQLLLNKIRKQTKVISSTAPIRADKPDATDRTVDDATDLAQDRPSTAPGPIDGQSK